GGDFYPIDGHAARIRHAQACEKGCDGGLAGTRCPDHRYGFTRLNSQRYIFYRPALTIGKGNVVNLHVSFFWWGARRCGGLRWVDDHANNARERCVARLDGIEHAHQPHQWTTKANEHEHGTSYRTNGHGS